MSQMRTSRVSKALFGRDLLDRSDVVFSSRITAGPTALEARKSSLESTYDAIKEKIVARQKS
jgi:hypothetical protein